MSETEYTTSIDAEYLAGRRFPYQEDMSLVRGRRPARRHPRARTSTGSRTSTLLEEDGVPAVFDRYSNSFLKIYFAIPSGREDEIARKVLIKHLQSGNSYGIALKERHCKFPQPELGPWVEGSRTVGTDWTAARARGLGASAALTPPMPSEADRSALDPARSADHDRLRVRRAPLSALRRAVDVREVRPDWNTRRIPLEEYAQLRRTQLRYRRMPLLVSALSLVCVIAFIVLGKAFGGLIWWRSRRPRGACSGTRCTSGATASSSGRAGTSSPSGPAYRRRRRVRGLAAADELSRRGRGARARGARPGRRAGVVGPVRRRGGRARGRVRPARTTRPCSRSSSASDCDWFAKGPCTVTASREAANAGDSRPRWPRRRRGSRRSHRPPAARTLAEALALVRSGARRHRGDPRAHRGQLRLPGATISRRRVWPRARPRSATSTRYTVEGGNDRIARELAAGSATRSGCRPR